MIEPTILPGARVRTEVGLLGTVERVESQGALVVRATGGQRYRFPAERIRELGEESEQSVFYTVVTLAVSGAELDGFLLGDELATPAPTPAAAPTPAPAVESGATVARIPLVAERLVARVPAGAAWDRAIAEAGGEQ